MILHLIKFSQKIHRYYGKMKTIIAERGKYKHYCKNTF